MQSGHQQTAQVTAMDLRQMAAHERRPRVFDQFDHMQAGDILLLTHSHHSTPLFYLLLAEAPLRFTWEYLEQGPECWRIKICKLPSSECGLH